MRKKIFMKKRLSLLISTLTILSITTLGEVKGAETEAKEDTPLLVGSSPIVPAVRAPNLQIQENMSFEEQQISENKSFAAEMKRNAKVRRITGGTTYFLAGIATTFATLSTQSSDPVRKDIFGWVTVGAGIGVLLAKSIETCLIGPREQETDSQLARTLQRVSRPTPSVTQHASQPPLATPEAMAEALTARSKLWRL